MITLKHKFSRRQFAWMPLVLLAACALMLGGCEFPVAEQPVEEPAIPDSEELEAALAKLEAHTAQVEQQLALDYPAQIGVSEEEFTLYLSRLREIKASYEHRLAMTAQIGPLVESHAELTDAAAPLEGLPDPPPYTLSYVDGLRDIVASRELEHDADTLEAQRARQELNRLEEQVAERRAALAEARQELEANTDPAATPRLEWRVELERAGARAAEEAVTTQELAVRIAELNAAISEAQLRRAQRHVDLALQQVRFPADELEERLQNIEQARFDVEAALAEARSELAAEEARLARAREALAEARDEEVIHERRRVLNAREIITQTARRRVALLQELLDYKHIEAQLWRTRYELFNMADPNGLRAMAAETAHRLERIREYRAALDSRIEGLRTQAAAFEQRLEAMDPDDPAFAVTQEAFEALEERRELNQENLDRLRDIQQLAQRVDDEIATAIRAEPELTTLRDYWHTLRDSASALWNQVVIGDIAGEYALTVRQIAIAIAILVVGFLISRRLSRFVRYVMLRRAELDENVTATVEKILYYLLLVGVALYAMYSMNIPLTVFTIFGGAVAIGVGFGAQNIINNFISGIIIMAEQPIRIRDYVEVDGELGQVVNIGARCSHVRAFNGTEILIPNSTFLEKKVVNWTLSDSQLRFEVTVGVAHGSPTREVSRLMQRAVQDHGQVLNDPAPVVLLQEFGENALVFQVFFWLEMTDRHDVRIICSDVRFRIERLFRDAGIKLAYPQRNLHLDPSRPLNVRMVTNEETVFEEEESPPNLPD